MRNITLSANEDLIDDVRKIAEQRHESLNEMFRDWLQSVVRANRSKYEPEQRARLWRHTGSLRVGKKLTREEMNAR